MKWLFVSILFICLNGCTNKDTGINGILSKEKMQSVMWDIIGADVFTEQFIKKDSLKNASIENMQLQNKIFALHKVNRVDFYKSYEYYVEHTSMMKNILDSMTIQAERNRSKMMEQLSEANNKGNQADSLKRHFFKLFFPFSPENQGKGFLHH
jgi:Domain of unknown function (DUF4296)